MLALPIPLPLLLRMTVSVPIVMGVIGRIDLMNVNDWFDVDLFPSCLSDGDRVVRCRLLRVETLLLGGF